MPKPRDIHELKSLQGKLAYLKRLIINPAGRCRPFSRLMKKGVPFKWDQVCSNAFEIIKNYLMKPPVLAAPIPGKPLILYIAAQERSVGALLAQENNHPIPDNWELTDELHDKDAMIVEVQPPCKMYFDGVAHRGGAGTVVVFITSQGEVMPYSFTLTQLCSNNIAEFQELILGLERAVDMKQLQLKENKKADALVSLASSLTLLDQAQVTICQKWVVSPPNEAEGEKNELKHLVAVFEVEKNEWRQPIIDYLCYGILLENPRRRTEIRRRALLYYKDTLYRRSFEGVLLQCLGEDEALQALQEAHSGKVVSKSKRDWHDRMEEALWEYRTTHRTPTQVTPYALVYGVEAALPLERQIPSLRLAIKEGITNEENARLWLVELEALDEKRLEAQQSLECYQARLSHTFNKRVCPRSFQVGDQFLVV
ncbi:uncharacterized protein [Nicotiana sylvestris]|uniref:uncharacterized protein n=1 Tax=Nicotiana sylvestris TaxID=4096 RepID=UPI00388CE43F